MEKNPTMTVVAAALLDGEGRVLLQQRAPGRAMAGLWEFPGGKVEEGELPEAALARELAEELGIGRALADVAPACFASAPVGERHMVLLLYLCRRWRGEPRPLDASALAWLTPAEMRRGGHAARRRAAHPHARALMARARHDGPEGGLERLRLLAMAVSSASFPRRDRARDDPARPLSDGLHLLLGGGEAGLEGNPPSPTISRAPRGGASGDPDGRRVPLRLSARLPDPGAPFAPVPIRWRPCLGSASWAAYALAVRLWAPKASGSPWRCRRC